MQGSTASNPHHILLRLFLVVTFSMCNVLLALLQITNTATAVPEGGSQAVTGTATIQVMAIGCAGTSPLPLPPAVALPVPPSPTPLVGSRAQSSSPLVPTVSQDIKVAAVGGYEWSVAVTSNADGTGSFAVPFGSSRTVTYTVSARRRSGFTYYVSGFITVKNTNDATVSATAVVAQLPMGSVPAACGPSGRLPLQVPAGGTLDCVFNASLTEAAPGTVYAIASSAFGSSASETYVPYKMDATPLSPAGSCAVLADAVGTKPALPSAGITLANNRPADVRTQPVCMDTVYNFTATFGPFPERACNNYLVGVLCTTSVRAHRVTHMP